MSEKLREAVRRATREVLSDEPEIPAEELCDELEGERPQPLG